MGVALLAAGAFSVAASPADRAPDLPSFPIERGPLVLEVDAHEDSFVECLGEEAGIWGTAGGGLEAWAYPFKLFEGLELSVSTDGGATFRKGSDLARRQIAAPHLAELVLAGPGVRLTETFFAPRALPAVAVLLSIESERDVALELSFRPSLAPMHLAREAPHRAAWNADRRRLTVREPARGVELAVASPSAVSALGLETVASSSARDEPTGSDPTYTLRLAVSPEAARGRLVPVYFAASLPDGPPIETTLGALETDLGALLRESRAHYEDILSRAPQIDSPDPEVDRALAWSAVSLDQLRVRNPDLGRGLVSGYSPSRGTTRPRYAWFFEEPMLTGRAYHRQNLSGHVEDAFRFLLRYQREDGKTVHEVTQSLRYRPDYLETSRYAYAHTDGPVYYIVALGDHWRATGDRTFLREQWPKIVRALEWCFSVADPEDGLLRIDPGDWGSAESSTKVGKDTQLEAAWIRALGSIEELARVLEEDELVRRAAAARKKASRALEAKLWNEEASTYRWGIDRRGRPLDALVPHHAIGVWFGSFRPDRAERMLETMAGADFRTDWGIRSLSVADPKHDPSSSQTGSVWPVWNAGVIIGDFRHHRAVEGFRNWRAMVGLRALRQLGPMPEVLDGSVYRKTPECVPHQQFSEVALVNGFYDGLLGLDVDVSTHTVRLSPWLPPHWERLSVRGIPAGKATLDLALEREPGGLRLRIGRRALGDLRLDLAPVLPAGCAIEKIELDGREVPYETERSTRATLPRLRLAGIGRKAELRIACRGGVGLLPVDRPPEIGKPSRNLRLIRYGLEEDIFRMTVEARPDIANEIDIFTERRLVESRGAKLAERMPRGYRLRLVPPEDAPATATGFARFEVVVALREEG